MTRFGVHLPTAPQQGFPHLAALATAAERAGFDTIWVSDRPAGASPPLPVGTWPPAPAPAPAPALAFETTTLLGALAARTSRIRLGALITDLSARNPAVLAKIITTLDVVAGGRSTLGFCGRPDAGALPADVLEESVRICRAMFTTDDVSFAGAHFVVEHARNIPRPVQAGGPRILVGPGGDGAILDLVARHADQCGVHGDAPTLARTVAALHGLCRQTGRDRAEIDVVWFTPCVLLAAGGAGTAASLEAVGPLTGRPDQIPALVDEHLRAGADEVVFTFASVDADGIGELGAAFGLGRP